MSLEPCKDFIHFGSVHFGLHLSALYPFPSPDLILGSRDTQTPTIAHHSSLGQPL